MKNNSLNFEELFHNKFDGYTEIPSAQVLKKIRFKLWLSDFASFNFKKFNFVYSLLIISAITFPFLIDTDREETKENSSLSTISTSQKSEINNSISESSNSSESSNNLAIIKNNLPAVDFEPSITQGCAPLNVDFKNTTINAVKYYWEFGNGEKSTQKNPSVLFSKPGQYTISLLATNSEGLTSTLKQTVIVYAKPDALAEIKTDDSDIKTKRIVFENKSTNADSYYWNFGDKSTSDKAEGIHTYNNFGKYNVVLIAYSQYGCSDTTMISNTFIEKNYELSFPPKFRPGTYNSQNSGFYENAADQNFIFYPLNNGASSYEFTIFAPNGIEVFKTNNVKQGWNGFIKGRIAPPGRYSFTAKGIYPNGKKFEIKSSVDVIVDEVNGYY